MRLQKFLSRAGVASRRKAEEWIAAGRVRVNGEVVRELGSRVDPAVDRIEVDGRTVGIATPRWVLLHKPPGVVTTASDPQGRPTVFDLLPAGSGSLRYVGRLDLDTEGLLLLTNQGDVAERLTHPRYQVEREYEAWVEGRPDAATLRTLTRGVELSDGPARALRAEPGTGKPDGPHVVLVLTEGRKREVRRLLEAVGHPVVRLRRVRFGPVQLGELAMGEWRNLTEEERRGLEAPLRTSEAKQ